jgi:PTH1 family peptidyl-tRNA hydrolase
VREGSAGRDQLLVVGLGNPEPEYTGTRHNVGSACLREAASRFGAGLDRQRWRALVGRAEVAGDRATVRAWFVWPQTYMNLSGRSVAAALRDLGLDAGALWVIHDELDLPLCRLRIRRGGSDAGNNGVRSVIGSLGTNDFVRFRIGVGKPPSTEAGVDYVLGRFSRTERERLDKVVPAVADAVETALRNGLERAMESYNRRGSLGCDELP